MCYLEAEEYVGIVLVMKINAHVRAINAFFMHRGLDFEKWGTQKNTNLFLLYFLFNSLLISFSSK